MSETEDAIKLADKILDRPYGDPDELAMLSRQFLRGRKVLAAKVAEIARLEAENFALAADQCDDGYGDEWGNHQCRRVDEAVGECANLAKIVTAKDAVIARLREALEFISDEDNAEVPTRETAVGHLQSVARAALAETGKK
jgi:hypothetical protein